MKRRTFIKLGAAPFAFVEVPGVDAACKSPAGLTKLRKRVAPDGITMGAVPLPLSSAYITRTENPAIMLGKSPERDRNIDNTCSMIRNCGKAGIPMVKYNLTMLGVVQTASTSGRLGPKDTGGHQSFGFGYIRGLLHAVQA